MGRDASILIVEDDADSRSALREYLETSGYRVRIASTAEEGLRVLAMPGEVDAVLLDLVMPDIDGFELLRRHREREGRAAIVVLSGLSQAENVVKAMRLGATDYLPKPLDAHELDLVLRRVLESCVLGRPAPAPAVQAPPGKSEPYVGQVTVSAVMGRVWAFTQRVADTDVPVLVVGETGVGKDVVARRLHAASQRARRPFIKINCAALPGELLESELATRRAPSRARTRRSPASSSWPTRAPCSSTRSARSIHGSRRS